MNKRNGMKVSGNRTVSARRVENEKRTLDRDCPSVIYIDSSEFACMHNAHGMYKQTCDSRIHTIRVY